MMGRTGATRAAAFAMLITLTAPGVSSCSSGGDERASEEPSTDYPTVPLIRACDSILPKEAAVEIRSSLGIDEVRVEKTEGSIEEKAREAFDEGHDSDFTLVCRFYTEIEDEEVGMSVDFRRENGAPPTLHNSEPSWTFYRIGKNALLRENENITHLDTLCLTPGSPGDSDRENTISLSLTEDMGISSKAKASILAATAEKVASGLRCTNNVSFPSEPKITPLPQK
ncbi:hypothetical protein [Streptomyces carminius]|uniref:hypothetical protein n=1 Tax=Streptomyces carminius TaxID=2665496 RepID=UPI0011B613B3|nr:hypothetical protein [Streptomyces carminius]